MLSRVAESIYWLNRYVERAENVARFIEVNFNLTLGENVTLGKQWQPLINTTGDDDDFLSRYESNPSRENVIRFLLFDRENANSIISCVARARENARAIRQIIPSVVWEELNKFYWITKGAAEDFERQGEEQQLNDTQAFCETVRLTSHLLVGALDATMSKGEEWHFARLGRMIERADKTSRIVDVQYFILLPSSEEVGSTLDIVRWAALLQSSNALVMYRRQYGNITPGRVAEFLILDKYFPRSMHHCALTASESLSSLCGLLPESIPGDAGQELDQLCQSMSNTTIQSIVEMGMHEYIDDFQSRLNRIGGLVAEEFFTWQPVS